MCVCSMGGHRKCIDLQPIAATSLDDGDCGPQKGHNASQGLNDKLYT